MTVQKIGAHALAPEASPWWRALLSFVGYP
jgi:hypothetical protein